MRLPWNLPKKEQTFLDKWGDLSQYHAEVARGIEHTPAWNRKMREKQAEYERALELGTVWDAS